jgi:hypothetical protein
MTSAVRDRRYNAGWMLVVLLFTCACSNSSATMLEASVVRLELTLARH